MRVEIVPHGDKGLILPSSLEFATMPREGEWISIDFTLYLVEAVVHKFNDGRISATQARVSKFKPT